MENNFYWWLLLGLFFLIIELTNPGFFFFFSFFWAALSAALLARYESSLFLQIITFFGASAVSFGTLCLWFKRKHYRVLQHGSKTNVAALQGKRAVVIEEIAPYKRGLIKVGGEVWAAQSRDSEHCNVGAVVEIIDIIGCHCVVRLVS